MAEERISNIRTVRAFATENREIQAYDQQMDNVLAKAKVEVVVATKKGAICQRRTYRFEDSVHQFFRRLQSVMEVDMLEAEAAILIYVDGEKIGDWDGTIMGDIIDVDSMFMVVLR